MVDDTNETFLRIQRRAEVLRGVRSWFYQAGFLEVDAPILVPGTGCEPFIDPLQTSLFWEVDGPNENRYLHTSPELYLKRLLARVSHPLFYVGHVFRNGEWTKRHLPEFTMMEWYRPEGSLEDLVRDCESWIGHVIEMCLQKNLGPDLDVVKMLREAPYEIVSMSSLWQKYAGIDLKEALLRVQEHGAHELVSVVKKAGFSLRPRADFDDAFFQVMSTAVEPNIGKTRPTVVTQWPKQMAVLSKLDSDDPLFARRFEIYAGGLELANAFDELTDGKEQKRRFLADYEKRRAMGRASLTIDEIFLSELDQIPATVGIAFGLDRLLQLIFGLERIENTYPLYVSRNI